MAIKVKKISEITREIYSSFGVYAKADWDLTYPQRGWLYRTSRRLWLLEVDADPVCVIGLKFNTLLGTGAEIYFLLCRKFASHIRKMSHFIRRALRRMVKLYGSLTVKVDSGYWVGRKFVEFFGFVNQGQIRATETINYNIYELRATWLQQHQ